MLLEYGRRVVMGRHVPVYLYGSTVQPSPTSFPTSPAESTNSYRTYYIHPSIHPSESTADEHDELGLENILFGPAEYQYYYDAQTHQLDLTPIAPHRIAIYLLSERLRMAKPFFNVWSAWAPVRLLPMCRNGFNRRIGKMHQYSTVPVITDWRTRLHY